MALRIYKVGALTFQFEEGQQPAGAVLVEDAKPAPARKAARPANKARKAVQK